MQSDALARLKKPKSRSLKLNNKQSNDPCVFLHLAPLFAAARRRTIQPPSTGEFEKADELLEQSIKELEKRLDELPAVTQKKVEETDAGRRLF